MERRTQPGYEYHSCDFMDEGVYIDMNLLREYEDTGLTPEQIMELKERDTGVKPIFLDGWDMCGNCGECLVPVDRFCPECGKRIKWEE